MERIRNLNRYQKGVLIFMTFIALIFVVIYPITISKVGYRYHDAILVPTQENGKIIYTGKLQGEQAQFIRVMVLNMMKMGTSLIEWSLLH